MFQAESLSFTAKVEDLSSHGIAAPVEEKYWHRRLLPLLTHHRHRGLVASWPHEG